MLFSAHYHALDARLYGRTLDELAEAIRTATWFTGPISVYARDAFRADRWHILGTPEDRTGTMTTPAQFTQIRGAAAAIAWTWHATIEPPFYGETAQVHDTLRRRDLAASAADRLRVEAEKLQRWLEGGDQRWTMVHTTPNDLAAQRRIHDARTMQLTEQLRARGFIVGAPSLHRRPDYHC